MPSGSFLILIAPGVPYTRWPFVCAPWAWVREILCVDMTTDASGSWGLGASLGDHTLQRSWSESELDLPIFHKELLAVVEALVEWAPLLC